MPPSRFWIPEERVALCCHRQSQRSERRVMSSLVPASTVRRHRAQMHSLADSTCSQTHSPQHTGPKPLSSARGERRSGVALSATSRRLAPVSSCGGLLSARAADSRQLGRRTPVSSCGGLPSARAADSRQLVRRDAPGLGRESVPPAPSGARLLPQSAWEPPAPAQLARPPTRVC